MVASASTAAPQEIRNMITLPTAANAPGAEKTLETSTTGRPTVKSALNAVPPGRMPIHGSRIAKDALNAGQ